MYLFVPHSHAISIFLMLPLSLKISSESSLIVSFTFENLVRVLPSTMSFYVSDNVFLLIMLTDREEPCSYFLFWQPFWSDDLFLQRHIFLLKTEYFGKLTFSIQAFWLLWFVAMGLFWLPYTCQTRFLSMGPSWYDS